MERDFMGLNSKDSVVVVKEETIEGCNDSGFGKSSGVPWPFLSKVCAHPHFMSLKTEQDEISPKIKCDNQTSTAFIPKSTLDVYDASHKRYSSNIENVQPGSLPHDVKMHPLSFAHPFLKSHFAIAGQNFGGSTMKQPFLGASPFAAPHSSLPSSGSVAGTTDQWFNSKAPGTPAQMTIFYAGTVNVFDDITPEKAQAIMLLAGNGCITSTMGQQRSYAQAPASKLAAADSAFMNRKMNAPSCSGILSPHSISSHPIDVVAKNEDGIGSKPIGISSNLVSKVEPPTSRMMTGLGPVAANPMISAVPQARKASLARFLEKRKERAMSSAPYKKSNECGTSESNGFAVSATSGVGSETNGDI